MFAKVKGSFQMLVKCGQMLDKMRGAHSFQKKMFDTFDKFEKFDNI